MKIQKSLKIADYNSHLQQINTSQQAFIIDLRNNLNHHTWFTPDWLISGSGEERTTHYNLTKSTLLLSDRWNKEAKKYLASAPEKIDVQELFVAYYKQIENFYSWFFIAIEENLPVEALDYMRCKKAIMTYSTRSSYNLIISTLLQSNKTPKLDPYLYLDRYLTPEELFICNSFPKHSAMQIDYIISVIDEYDACDAQLRDKVYQLFGVIDKLGSTITN